MKFVQWKNIIKCKERWKEQKNYRKKENKWIYNIITKKYYRAKVERFKELVTKDINLKNPLSIFA